VEHPTIKSTLIYRISDPITGSYNVRLANKRIPVYVICITDYIETSHKTKKPI